MPDDSAAANKGVIHRMSAPPPAAGQLVCNCIVALEGPRNGCSVDGGGREIGGLRVIQVLASVNAAAPSCSGLHSALYLCPSSVMPFDWWPALILPFFALALGPFLPRGSFFTADLPSGERLTIHSRDGPPQRGAHHLWPGPSARSPRGK